MKPAARSSGRVSHSGIVRLLVDGHDWECGQCMLDPFSRFEVTLSRASTHGVTNWAQLFEEDERFDAHVRTRAGFEATLCQGFATDYNWGTHGIETLTLRFERVLDGIVADAPTDLRVESVLLASPLLDQWLKPPGGCGDGEASGGMSVLRLFRLGQATLTAEVCGSPRESPLCNGVPRPDIRHCVRVSFDEPLPLLASHRLAESVWHLVGTLCGIRSVPSDRLLTLHSDGEEGQTDPLVFQEYRLHRSSVKQNKNVTSNQLMLGFTDCLPIWHKIVENWSRLLIEMPEVLTLHAAYSGGSGGFLQDSIFKLTTFCEAFHRRKHGPGQEVPRAVRRSIVKAVEASAPPELHESIRNCLAHLGSKSLGVRLRELADVQSRLMQNVCGDPAQVDEFLKTVKKLRNAEAHGSSIPAEEGVLKRLLIVQARLELLVNAILLSEAGVPTPLLLDALPPHALFHHASDPL